MAESGIPPRSFVNLRQLKEGIHELAHVISRMAFISLLHDKRTVALDHLWN